jgi:hypothetical protein
MGLDDLFLPGQETEQWDLYLVLDGYRLKSRDLLGNKGIMEIGGTILLPKGYEKAIEINEKLKETDHNINNLYPQDDAFSGISCQVDFQSLPLLTAIVYHPRLEKRFFASLFTGHTKYRLEVLGYPSTYNKLVPIQVEEMTDFEINYLPKEECGTENPLYLDQKDSFIKDPNQFQLPYAYLFFTPDALKKAMGEDTKKTFWPIIIGENRYDSGIRLNMTHVSGEEENSGDKMIEALRGMGGSGINYKESYILSPSRKIYPIQGSFYYESNDSLGITWYP